MYHISLSENGYTASTHLNYARIKTLRNWINALYLVSAFMFPFTRLFQFMVIAALIFHLMTLLLTDEKQLAHAQVVWTFLFGLYFILHQLLGFTLMPYVSFNRLLTCLIYYVIINSFISQISTEDGFRVFLNSLTYALLLLSAILIFHQFGTLGAGGGGFGTNTRMGDTSIVYPIIGYVGYNPNWIGLPSAMCVVMHIYAYEKDNRLVRFLFIVLLTICVLLSGSRKALIICIGSPLVYLFFKDRNFNKKIKMIGIGIMIGILLITAMIKIPLLYKVMGGRMENYVLSLFGKADLIERSAIYRNQMTDEAVRLFLERPWLGYGIESYRFLTSSVADYSHNNYTELMVSGGIIALLIYYWFYLYIIIRTLLIRGDRKKRALSLSIILLLPLVEYGWILYVDRSICVPMAIACYAITSMNREKTASHRTTHLRIHG